MNKELPLCVHRYSTIKTVYFDRFKWLVIQRCRRCARVEQITYWIETNNGLPRTYSRTNKVENVDITSTPTKQIDNSTNESGVNEATK